MTGYSDNVGGPGAGPGVNDDRIGVRTYLSNEEAREFHRLFMVSFILFTLVAIVAHFLVYSWRPWLPGPNGYSQNSAVQLDSRGAPVAAQHS